MSLRDLVFNYACIFFNLFQIGHLAELEDQDIARVLSWHMSADMDCVVTTTTKKVSTFFFFYLYYIETTMAQALCHGQQASLTD